MTKDPVDDKKFENCLKTASSYGSVPDPEDPKIEKSEETKPKKFNYTPNQKLALLVLALGNFCAGACSSLQAPFFPSEAEKKGATATEYGFIFGVYQLTIVFTAPLIGKLVGHVSPKFILNSGFFILGVTSILFGILDLVNKTTPFVVLAFVVRSTEGVGASCVRVASSTLIASMFGQELGTTYAILEMCTGVGAIIGPVLGGALYELGGYECPFLAIGGLTLLDAVFVYFVLPEVERKTKEETKSANIFKVWVKPGILIYSFSIFTSFSFIGFNQAGLEPHVREYDLSKFSVGLVFSILGLVYAVSSPFWGWLHDSMCNSNLIHLVGCLIFISGILFIGPVPFIPIDPNLYLIGLSMTAIGFSVGAKTVSCFTGALQSATKIGLPEDLATYGLIASIITSSKSFGSFFGPSVGGIMLDDIGYRAGSMLYLGLEIVLVIYLTIILFTEEKNNGTFSTQEKDCTVSDNKKKKFSLISVTYGTSSLKRKDGEEAITLNNK